METICNYSKSSWAGGQAGRQAGGIITRVSLEGQGLLEKQVGEALIQGEPSQHLS